MKEIVDLRECSCEMSLRDRFAIEALNGLMRFHENFQYPSSRREIAKLAYEIADFMMSERSKKNQIPKEGAYR